MSCSLDKTRKQMRKEGIITNWDALKDTSVKGYNAYNAYVQRIKNLAKEKFGFTSMSPFLPIQDGKVVFNKAFFERVDRYNSPEALYGQDNEVSKNLTFSEETLNSLRDYIKQLGIEEKFVDSLPQDAMVAVNFSEGTINWSNAYRNLINDSKDLTEDQKLLKLSEYWGKLPEETAHWWYRLLKHSDPLKQALWDAAKDSQKLKDLLGKNYGNYNSIDTLTEEAIGQLIAESIQRLEAQKATKADRTLLQKIVGLFASLADFALKAPAPLDPFDEAAKKILAKDIVSLYDLNFYTKVVNKLSTEAMNRIIQSTAEGTTLDNTTITYKKGGVVLTARLRLERGTKNPAYDIIVTDSTRPRYSERNDVLQFVDLMFPEGNEFRWSGFAPKTTSIKEYLEKAREYYNLSTYELVKKQLQEKISDAFETLSWVNSLKTISTRISQDADIVALFDEYKAKKIGKGVLIKRYIDAIKLHTAKEKIELPQDLLVMLQATLKQKGVKIFNKGHFEKIALPTVLNKISLSLLNQIKFDKWQLVKNFRNNSKELSMENIAALFKIDTLLAGPLTIPTDDTELEELRKGAIKVLAENAVGLVSELAGDKGKESLIILDHGGAFKIEDFKEEYLQESFLPYFENPLHSIRSEDYPEKFKTLNYTHFAVKLLIDRLKEDGLFDKAMSLYKESYKAIKFSPHVFRQDLGSFTKEDLKEITFFRYFVLTSKKNTELLENIVKKPLDVYVKEVLKELDSVSFLKPSKIVKNKFLGVYSYESVEKIEQQLAVIDQVFLSTVFSDKLKGLGNTVNKELAVLKVLEKLTYKASEAYERGYGFYHGFPGYSSRDINLNEVKSFVQSILWATDKGTYFPLSTYTERPVDAHKPDAHNLSHDADTSKQVVRVVLFPEDKDIKIASNTDVYTGQSSSVRLTNNISVHLPATKYTFNRVEEVVSSIAASIEEQKHHHNEQVIDLKKGRFLLEWEDSLPEDIKNFLESVNAKLKEELLVDPSIIDVNSEYIPNSPYVARIENKNPIDIEQSKKVNSKFSRDESQNFQTLYREIKKSLTEEEINAYIDKKQSVFTDYTASFIKDFSSFTDISDMYYSHLIDISYQDIYQLMDFMYNTNLPRTQEAFDAFVDKEENFTPKEVDFLYGLDNNTKVSPLQEVKTFLKAEDYRLKSPAHSWIYDKNTSVGKLLEKITIPEIKDALLNLRAQYASLQTLQTNAREMTNALYKEANIDVVQLEKDEATQLENVARATRGEERLPTLELDKLNALEKTNPELYDKIEDLGEKRYQLIRQSTNAFDSEVKKFFNSLMSYEQKELGESTPTITGETVSEVIQSMTLNLIGGEEELPTQVATESPSPNNNAKQAELVAKLKKVVDVLGITIAEVTEIYDQQQELNSLYKQLETSKNPATIQAKIDTIKRTGLKGKSLALADTLNRVINVTKLDDYELSSQLFTEEVLHFAVDIIEQKYPELYAELDQKVRSYAIFPKIYSQYSSNPDYQKDGKPNDYKIRKEAIAKILTHYLTTDNFEDSEYQLNKTEGLIKKIITALKRLFNRDTTLYTDSFQEVVDELFNTTFITPEDAKYLSGDTYSGLVSAVEGAYEGVQNFFTGIIDSRMENKEVSEDIMVGRSAAEIIELFLKDKANFSRVMIDGEERYTYKGEVVPKRVSDYVNSFVNSIFKDSKLVDKSIKELALEDGKDVHSLFELTFEKYVDPATGKVRPTPIGDPTALQDFKENKFKLSEADRLLGMMSIPDMIEVSVKELIAQYPKAAFLTEIPIISKKKYVAGTIDLFIVEPSGKVHILDWKTKRGEFKEGVMRTEIPAWNMKAWRIQLDKYVEILKSAYGVTNFGKVRDIPIMKFEKVDASGQPRLYQIQIGSLNDKLVDLSQRQLLPLPATSEQTGFTGTDTLIGRIYGQIAELDKRAYAKFHKKADKDDLKLKSRILHDIAVDLQISKSMSSLKDNLLKVLTFHDGIIKKDAEGTLTREDFIETARAIKDLSIYENIINVVEELVPQKLDGSPVDKMLADDMKVLGTDMQIKKDKLEQILLKAADLYASEEFGMHKVSATENQIKRPLGFLPYATKTLFNSVYQADSLTGQLLGRLFMKANNEIDAARVDIANKFEDARRSLFSKNLGVLSTDAERFALLLKTPTAEELEKSPNLKNTPRLISKISSSFYDEFDAIRLKFKEASDRNKGAFAQTKVTTDYKDVVKWLERNIDITQWQKDFDEKKKKYIKTIETNLSHITDAKEKSKQSEELLSRWSYYNNILESPQALSAQNILEYLNEELWYSEEYKVLLEPGNEELLKAYELFRNTAIWAKRVGYSKAIYNLPTRISTKENLKYKWNLVAGPLQKELSWNALGESIHGVGAFLREDTAIDETEYGFQKLNPVTLQEEYDIPVRMMDDMEYEVKDGKKVYPKDLDLLLIYETLALNLAEYETYSAIEEYAHAILAVEEAKKMEYSTNIVGNRGQKVYKGGFNFRENLLTNTINATLYDKRREEDRNFFSLSLNKFISFVSSYSSALYLSANYLTTASAYAGSSFSALFNSGETYKGSNFLKQSVMQVIPVLMNKDRDIINRSFAYKVSPKALNDLRMNHSAFLKRQAVLGKEYLLNSLSVVDIYIQEQVFFASLPNFAVINNKIVNIHDYAWSDYTDYYSADKSQSEREEIKQKVNEKIKELEADNLEKYLENLVEKQKETLEDPTTSLTGLDLSSLNQESVREFENRIRGESKRILGNMSEKDFYPGLLGNMSRLAFQFKTWTLNYLKARISKFHYDPELGRFIYGRYNASIDFLFVNRDITLKSIGRLMQLIAPFYNLKNSEDVNKVLVAKYTQYANKVKLEGGYLPTEYEYIDTYLKEITAIRNEIIGTLFVASTVAIMFGDDPDKEKDSAFEYYYKQMIRKVLKELRFPNDPVQMLKMIAAPPAFGALAEFAEAIYYLRTKNRTSEVLEAIPVARQASAVAARYSPSYAKAINVDKRHNQLKEPKEGEEIQEVEVE